MGNKGMLTQPALFVSIVGLTWNSHYLNSHQRVELDDYLEAGAPPLPTSRHRDFWEFNESTCFHLDNICSRNDGWFYSPNQWDEKYQQPTTALFVNYDDIAYSHGFDIDIEKRIQFNVSSTSHQLHDDTCSFSRTPYHMVVQSAYSEMMGEFYSRIILGLNRWMRDFPLRSNDDLQMYTHFVDRRKQKLLEGHHLFLGGLPNNNKFDNFLSLMPNGSCRCYTKLIFCGYDVENATARSFFNYSSTVDDPDDNITVIKPRSLILNPKTWCSMKTDPHALKHGNCVAYRKLRRDLFNTYSEKDPMLGEKISQYRRQILIEKGYINNSTNNIDEWKFVGLANRKSRRKWLNIQEATSMCDVKFTKHKVVCITVDVEEADSPEEQLLMHRSLHAFIGVHGAQLTQGVLLPRHSYILELLPWVPFYLWGGWVATIHRPTPLGIIFHKTDLNHVGYPLGRVSVPLCLHLDSSDRELERECLMNETSGVIKKFRWAVRDFNVPIKVIKDFIVSFLLKENYPVCDEMRKRAEQKNFVLYNAFCRRSANETNFVAEHYFREEDKKQPKNIHNNEKATWKGQGRLPI